ncbi:MAG TPA: hypothetical protein VIG33_04095 [Pseudobdellovibrionaceae bacterium]|jgi:hypothetical protein
MQSIRPSRTNLAFGARHQGPLRSPQPRQQEFIELRSDGTYEVISAAFKSVSPILKLADRLVNLSSDESSSLFKAFRKFDRRSRYAKAVTPPRASDNTEDDAKCQPSEGDEFQLRKRPPVTIMLSPEDYRVISREYEPIPQCSDELVVKLELPFLPNKKQD